MKRLLGSFLCLAWLAAAASAQAAVTHFVIERDNPPTIAGSYISLTITPFNGGTPSNDYFGSVTFTVSTGPGTYSPTASGFFQYVTASSATQWIGSIQIKTAADSVTITCTGQGGTTGSIATQIVAGPVVDSLIVVPGQAYTPGLSPGVNPSTVDLIQGTDHPVTVYVVDQYWNWNKTWPGTIDLINPAGSVAPSGSIVTSDGHANFSVNFSISGGITLTSTQPYAASRYVTVYDASQAYSHVVSALTLTAGIPFPLTVTVSTDSSNPYPGISAANGDRLELKRFITGSTTPAPGTWQPTEQVTLGPPNPAGTYFGWFTYDHAGSILLRADKASGSSVVVTSVPTMPITVNPNLPAALQLAVSPSEIQTRHAAQITALALDAYGNPTYSALYPFAVAFEQVVGNGYLSLTETATDSAGYAASTFTGGYINELAQIRVRAVNTWSGQVYAENLINVKVSVAPPAAGAILNYPNPFNPARNQSTSVNYYLESDSDVEIRIYDPFGRVVLSRDFAKDSADPVARSATQTGGAAWTWDGRNQEGRVVGNGIYLVKIMARGDKRQEFKRRVGVLK